MAPSVASRVSAIAGFADADSDDAEGNDADAEGNDADAEGNDADAEGNDADAEGNGAGDTDGDSACRLSSPVVRILARSSGAKTVVCKPCELLFNSTQRRSTSS